VPGLQGTENLTGGDRITRDHGGSHRLDRNEEYPSPHGDHSAIHDSSGEVHDTSEGGAHYRDSGRSRYAGREVDPAMSGGVRRRRRTKGLVDDSWPVDGPEPSPLACCADIAAGGARGAGSTPGAREDAGEEAHEYSCRQGAGERAD